MKFINKNYYEILDIEPAASEEDIKRAYRLVRGTWNPDSIAVYSLYTPEENDAIGHKIEEAFQILSNTEKRKSYDRYMRDVDRLPAHIKSPGEFWDFVHGIAPPDDDDELLDDVSDLLSYTGLEVVEEEEEENEQVLEASGGDARGYERTISGSMAVDNSQEAHPASTPLQDRMEPGTVRSVGAGSSPAQRYHNDQSLPISASAAPAPSTGGAVRVPAAPPAPPSKDSALWATRAPHRRSGSQKEGGPHQPHPRKAQQATLDRITSSPRSTDTFPESETDQAPADVQPAVQGWSRSYAKPFRKPPPIQEKPISTEMLAQLEAQHGLGGAYLKAIREYKGISLSDISERTKIQTTYLQYLEEERFKDLPARVYVEGFVTQYARLLKLESERVADGYMSCYARKTAPALPVTDFRDDA